MKLMNDRAQVQETARVEAKPCAWMGPHVPLDNGSNWRRLEQDYEFSDGYGLKEPGGGWEPLYDQAAIAAAVAAERERCAAIAAPEHIVFSDEEWRVRCDVRDSISE